MQKKHEMALYTICLFLVWPLPFKLHAGYSTEIWPVFVNVYPLLL